VAVAIAVGLVFILLFIALGSMAEVFVILLTLPDAFVGGILALLLGGQTLNVSSAVGFIGLAETSSPTAHRTRISRTGGVNSGLDTS
jgi:Cu/Ag efflux pump CusA